MAYSQADTVHDFDTWVRGKKGLLHFDVMTTDEAIAPALAKRYLEGLGKHDGTVTQKECQFATASRWSYFSPIDSSSSRNKDGSSFRSLPRR